MVTAILNILGSVAGLVATYYLTTTVAKWLRAYRERQNQAEIERSRSEAQRDNQAANDEHDRLRDIEGR